MKSVKAPERERERERERVLPFGRKPKQKRLATKDEKEHLKNLEWFTKFVGRCTAATFVLIVCSFVVMVGSNSKAADPESTPVSVRVLHACSMSSTSLSPHSVSTTPGTVISDIAQTKIQAFCNDSGGYAIYAIGESNGEDGNTDMISALGTSYNIPTGTATSGDYSAWAMKLTAGVGTGSVTTPPTISTGYDSYHEIPSTQTKVASRDSATSMSTDTVSTGSYLTAMYQIYTSGTQAAGTYNGQVRYTMVHPNDDRGLVTLEDALADAGAAQIEKGGKKYYTMQSLTPTICKNANVTGEASQIQLIDSRDNKLYWVTKTLDERCWMTQNLDLDLTNVNPAEKDVILTSENTDLNVIDSGAYANGYTRDATTGVISWNPVRSTIDASNNMTTTGTSGSISGWSNSDTIPYSVNVGNVYQTGNRADLSTCNYLTTACTGKYSNTAYEANGEHGHVGNYYNWTASIASNSSSSITTSTYNGEVQNNPQNSICPKNWKLPVIDAYTSGKTGNNDFYNLDYWYNEGKTNTDAGLMAAPLYFTRSGGVTSGTVNASGSRGFCWSSTVFSSLNAYHLYLNSDNVLPIGYDNRRYRGFPLRCVVAN